MGCYPRLMIWKFVGSIGQLFHWQIPRKTVYHKIWKVFFHSSQEIRRSRNIIFKKCELVYVSWEITAGYSSFNFPTSWNFSYAVATICWNYFGGSNPLVFYTFTLRILFWRSCHWLVRKIFAGNQDCCSHKSRNIRSLVFEKETVEYITKNTY